MKPAISIAFFVLVLAAAPDHSFGQVSLGTISDDEALVLVDSATSRIGEVFSISATTFGPAQPVVALELDLGDGNAKPVMVGVAHREFETTDIHFESDDCTGVPFIDMGDSFEGHWMPPHIVTGVNVPGQTLYIQASGNLEDPVIQSSRSAKDDGACVASEASDGPFLRVIPLIDLQTVWTPPFRIVIDDGNSG